METLEVPKDHYLVKSFTVYGKVAHIRWKSSEELAALISALLEVNPTHEVVAITSSRRSACPARPLRAQAQPSYRTSSSSAKKQRDLCKKSMVSQKYSLKS